MKEGWKYCHKSRTTKTENILRWAVTVARVGVREETRNSLKLELHTEGEEWERGSGHKKVQNWKTKGNWATLLLVNTLSQKSTNIKNFRAREAAFQFFSSAQKLLTNPSTAPPPFPSSVSPVDRDHAHHSPQWQQQQRRQEQLEQQTKWRQESPQRREGARWHFWGPPAEPLPALRLCQVMFELSTDELSRPVLVSGKQGGGGKLATVPGQNWLLYASQFASWLFSSCWLWPPGISWKINIYLWNY